MHSLVHDAGRHIELGKLLDETCGVPRFLDLLAARGDLWFFIGFKRSRWQFNQCAADGDSFIANQTHAAVVEDRHDRDRAGMMHDLARMDLSVASHILMAEHAEFSRDE